MAASPRPRPTSPTLLYRCKHLVHTHVLASELDILVEQLWRIAQQSRRTRDYTHNRLRTGLAEMIAAFPVYRTYIGDAGVTAEDRRFLDWALAAARRRGRAAESTVARLRARRAARTLQRDDDPELARRRLDFVARFQQVTSR